MLRNIIVINLQKRYNKSRLDSENDHLITMLTIPQMTRDKIFLDDLNALCPPISLYHELAILE